MKKPWQFTSLNELRKRARRNRTELVALLFILGIATFFRFWRLGATQYFTYDQARDFLIIKRIIVDHKLTLIGPSVLIPGVYRPPFYYYSLAPFLFIFKFSPLGADVYTALLGVGAVFVFYLLSREFFNKATACFSSLVFATLPMIVITSRHAWNPNTIYLFSLLLIFFIWRFIKENRWPWFYGALAAFSWSLSLHYNFLVFFPLLFFIFIWKIRKAQRAFFKIFFSFVALAVFVFPLFLFELRHGFLISTNMLKFIRQQGEASLFVDRFLRFFIDVFKMPFILFIGHLIPGVKSVKPSHIVLFDELSIFNLKLSLGQQFYFCFCVLITFLIFVAGIVVLVFKKLLPDKKAVFLIFSSLVLGATVRIIIPSKSFYFYIYSFLFPVVLFLLVNLFYVLMRRKEGIAAVLMIVIIFLFFGTKELKNLQPSERSEHFFQEAVEVIASDYFKDKSVNYAVAVNNADPNRWDHNALEYRYFLEAYHSLPKSDWEAIDYQQAEVLYLIDEGNLPDPLGLRGMEMEAFKPTQVEKTWQLSNGDKVYKLVKD